MDGLSSLWLQTLFKHEHTEARGQRVRHEHADKGNIHAWTKENTKQKTTEQTLNQIIKSFDDCLQNTCKLSQKWADFLSNAQR